MTPSKQAPVLNAISGATVRQAERAPWVLGIDPGLKGAIAALRQDFSEYKTWKMPVLSKCVDAVGLRDTLRGLLDDGGISLCVLEEAQVMRLQGISSALTIGRNYGVLVGVLEVTGVPFQELRPSAWKKAIVGSAPRVAAKTKPPKDADTTAPDGITGTGKKAKVAVARTVEDRKATKELALITARHLFPRLTFSATEDGPAEALLMAECARRLVLSGSLGAPAFVTQEEAQFALDVSREATPPSALTLRLASANKKKSSK